MLIPDPCHAVIQCNHGWLFSLSGPFGFAELEGPSGQNTGHPWSTPSD